LNNLLSFIAITLIVMGCGQSKTTEETKVTEEVQTSQLEIGVYELRTYYAADGKLDNLLARFRNHTAGLFEKHGMTNIAYWVPVDNKENVLIYLMGYPSRESRDQSFDNFRKDPDWIEAREASRVNGPLVDSVQNIFLKPTDYSPEAIIEDIGLRVFEMRTYYCNEGKLPNLHARFMDHTMGIFENNDMTNVAYFSFDSDQPGVENTLLYFITHADTAQARQNWGSFLDDAEWKEAYAASIADGNLVSSLTSVFMEPTDFSPMK